MCHILVHKSCKFNESPLQTIKIQINSDNEFRPIELQTFKCDSCKYKKRKLKEPRCFECYNEGGYIIGLINDTTQDRMVHPICALLNRRFTISSPNDIGFALSNKHQRKVIDDQKCFRCQKRIVYQCKCQEELCLVYAHYYCLNFERTRFQIGIEDKRNSELWNFQYSFQLENFNLENLPILKCQLKDYFSDENSFEENDYCFTKSNQLKSFIRKYSKSLNIIFRCNNHQRTKREICFCGKKKVDQFILCDVCNEWYHQSCINYTPSEIEGFTCQKCEFLQETSKEQYQKSLINNNNKLNEFYKTLFYYMNQYGFSLYEIFQVLKQFENQIEQIKPENLQNGLFYFILFDQMHWKDSFLDSFLEKIYEIVNEDKLKDDFITMFYQFLQVNEQIENGFNQVKVYLYAQEFKKQINSYVQEAQKFINKQSDLNQSSIQYVNHILKLIEQIFLQNNHFSEKVNHLEQLGKIVGQKIENNFIDKTFNFMNKFFEKLQENPQGVWNDFIEEFTMKNPILVFFMNEILQENELNHIFQSQLDQKYFQIQQKLEFQKTTKKLLALNHQFNPKEKLFYLLQLFLNDKLLFIQDHEQYLQKYSQFQDNTLYQQFENIDAIEKSVFVNQIKNIFVSKDRPFIRIIDWEKILNELKPNTKSYNSIKKFIEEQNKIIEEIKNLFKNEIPQLSLVEKLFQKLQVQSSFIQLLQKSLEIFQYQQQNETEKIQNNFIQFALIDDDSDIKSILEQYNIFDKLKGIFFQTFSNIDIHKENLEQQLSVYKLNHIFTQNQDFQKFYKCIEFIFKLFEKNSKQMLIDCLKIIGEQQIDIKILEQIQEQVDFFISNLNFSVNEEILKQIKEIQILCELNRFFYYFMNKQIDGVYLDKHSIELYQEKIHGIQNLIQGYKKNTRFADIKTFFDFSEEIFNYFEKKNNIQDNEFIHIEQFQNLPQYYELKIFLQNSWFNNPLLAKLKDQIQKSLTNCEDYHQYLIGYLQLSRNQNSSYTNFFKEINLQEIIEQTKKIKCIKKDTSTIFYHVQKAYVYQRIINSNKIKIKSCELFLQLYKEDNDFQFLNKSIEKTLEIHKILREIETYKIDYDLIKKLKEYLTLTNIDKIQIDQNKLRILQNLIELLNPRKEQYLEKYIELYNEVIMLVHQENMSIDQNLLSMLENQIYFFFNLQSRILLIKNQRRQLAPYLIDLIKKKKIKNIDYINQQLDVYKLNLYIIFKGEKKNEIFKLDNFLKELERFNFFPDNIQLYYVMIHYQQLIKKAKGNKINLTFEEIREYYEYLREIKRIISKIFYDKKYQLETANGFFYMIYLEFLKFFIECERQQNLKENEEQNFNIEFTKNYQLDNESNEYDFPILHIKINKRILSLCQEYFTIEEEIPKDYELKIILINNLRQKFLEKNFNSVIKLTDFFKEFQEQQLDYYDYQLNNHQLEQYFKNDQSLKLQEIEKLLEIRSGILVQKKFDIQEEIKKAIQKNQKFDINKHKEKVTSFSLLVSNAIQRDNQYNDKRSRKKLCIYLSQHQDLLSLIKKLMNLETNLDLIFNDINNKKKEKNQKTTVQVKKKKNFDEIFGQQINETKKPKKKAEQDLELFLTQENYNQIQSESDDSITEVTFKPQIKLKINRDIFQVQFPVSLSIGIQNQQNLNLQINLFSGETKLKLQQSPIIEPQQKITQIKSNQQQTQHLKSILLNNKNYCSFFTFIKSNDFWNNFDENSNIVFYSKTKTMNKIYLINYRYIYTEKIFNLEKFLFKLNENMLSDFDDIKQLFFMFLFPSNQTPQQQNIQIIQEQSPILDSKQMSLQIQNLISQNISWNKKTHSEDETFHHTPDSSNDQKINQKPKMFQQQSHHQQNQYQNFPPQNQGYPPRNYQQNMNMGYFPYMQQGQNQNQYMQYPNQNQYMQQRPMYPQQTEQLPPQQQNQTFNQNRLPPPPPMRLPNQQQGQQRNLPPRPPPPPMKQIIIKKQIFQKIYSQINYQKTLQQSFLILATKSSLGSLISILTSLSLPGSTTISIKLPQAPSI